MCPCDPLTGYLCESHRPKRRHAELVRMYDAGQTGANRKSEWR